MKDKIYFNGKEISNKEALEIALEVLDKLTVCNNNCQICEDKEICNMFHNLYAIYNNID